MTFSASIYASAPGGTAAYTEENLANLKALGEALKAKVEEFRAQNPNLTVGGSASGPGFSLTL